MKNVPTITKEMLANESFKAMLSGVIKTCEINKAYARDRYEDFGGPVDFNMALVHSAVRDTFMICEENFNDLLNMVICYQEKTMPSPLDLAEFMKTYGPVIEANRDVFVNPQTYEEYMNIIGETVPFLFQVIVMSEVGKGNIGLIDLDSRTGLDTDGDDDPFDYDDDGVPTNCPF